MRLAVCDHIILDAVVDLAGHHAVLHQVLLGAVWPEANNASGPTARHTGNLQQFIHAGMIDVYARLRLRRRCRCFGHSAGVSILILRLPRQANAQHHSRCCRKSHPCSQGSILCPAAPCPQVNHLTHAQFSLNLKIRCRAAAITVTTIIMELPCRRTAMA